MLLGLAAWIGYNTGYVVWNLPRGVTFLMQAPLRRLHRDSPQPLSEEEMDHSRAPR